VTAEQVIGFFRTHGGLLEGHFKLTSGRHSNTYLQSALVLQHPRVAEQLGAALAVPMRAFAPTVVISPAMGGILIGQEVARALDVRAVFAERSDGALTLRRGFALDPSDRVAVIEDVLTTGKSTRETMKVARDAGAVVVVAGGIIDRSSEPVDLGVPFFALAEMPMTSDPPESCPLCAQGIPAIKPGSRS
jgi:orotate phosphoribosyltransferase